jgi:hypothetical protein
MKRWFLFSVMLFLQACAFAPPIYYAEEIQAQIVDEETGKPLEKVIVVAQWEAEGVGLGDTPPNERLRIYETVTDENGFFTIPSGTMTHSLSHQLTDHDPDFFLFKKGYSPTVLGNSRAHDGVIRSSRWHGKQIKISQLKEGDVPFDVEVLIFSSFFSALKDGRVHEDWKNYPRMTLAFYEEEQRLLAKGASPWKVPYVTDIKSLPQEDKRFLEEFKHDF